LVRKSAVHRNTPPKATSSPNTHAVESEANTTSMADVMAVHMFILASSSELKPATVAASEKTDMPPTAYARTCCCCC